GARPGEGTRTMPADKISERNSGDDACASLPDRPHGSQKARAIDDRARQFELLVSGVRDYAIYMLDPDGTVVSWNNGAEHIKGYTAAEIIGQNFSKFYTPSDRAKRAPAHSLREAREQGRFEAVAQRMRKDGSLFWANVVIDAIRDESGHLIGFAKIT